MAVIIGTFDHNDGISAPALIGTADNDSIVGQFGNDRIEGLEGADTLIPGAGIDTVLGGGGDDTVIITSGIWFDKIVDGGEGRDKLVLASLGPVSIERVSILDFEIIEINGYLTRISIEDISQFDTIIGNGTIEIFGSAGSLFLAHTDWQGEELQVKLARGSEAWYDTFRIDASGSVIAWSLDSSERNSFDAVIGGANNDTLRGGNGDSLWGALLRKSRVDRGSPFPGQTYPTASVTGMPSAV